VPTGTYAVTISISLPEPLGTIGSVENLKLVQPGPDALDRVIARAMDKDSEVSWEAVDELRLFTNEGDRVVPVLLRLARNPECPCPFNAIYALRSFPDHADEFTPALVEVLDGDGLVRRAAASVLGDVGAPGLAEPALVRAAESGDDEIAPFAQTALNELRERTATIE